MAATSIELKAITKQIVSGHRPEVVSLVSLRNVVYVSTIGDPEMQAMCMSTLYGTISAKLREIDGDMGEFDRCAKDMQRAAVTIGMLNECPD